MWGKKTLERITSQWLCFNCHQVNPSIKPWRKRKESLTVCMTCGEKRQPRAI